MQTTHFGMVTTLSRLLSPQKPSSPRSKNSHFLLQAFPTTKFLSKMTRTICLNSVLFLISFLWCAIKFRVADWIDDVISEWVNEWMESYCTGMPVVYGIHWPHWTFFVTKAKRTTRTNISFLYLAITPWKQALFYREKNWTNSDLAFGFEVDDSLGTNLISNPSLHHFQNDRKQSQMNIWCCILLHFTLFPNLVPENLYKWWELVLRRKKSLCVFRVSYSGAFEQRLPTSNKFALRHQQSLFLNLLLLLAWWEYPKPFSIKISPFSNPLCSHPKVKVESTVRSSWIYRINASKCQLILNKRWVSDKSQPISSSIVSASF